jgi:hypothetical protein
VVTGPTEPGIGTKSFLITAILLNSVTFVKDTLCFLFYILRRRLCERRPTALDPGNIFILFDDDRVQAHDTSSGGHFFSPKGILGLFPIPMRPIDSHVKLFIVPEIRKLRLSRTGR